MDNYKTLEKIYKKVNDIDQACAILRWDMATVMPKSGAEARSEQLATLSSIKHALVTDDGVGDLLQNAGTQGRKLNDWQQANLKLMKRQWNHWASIPRNLIRQLVLEGSKCEMVWRTARADNDFNALAPHLKKVVNTVRQVASLKAEVFGCSPYEALLDEYDQGRKIAQLDQVFDNLKDFLPNFIGQVVEKQKSSKITPLKGPFAIEKQKNIATKIMKVIGFDVEQGRLDESHHPFCGGYPSDIRITTRYDENDFNSSFMGVVHESGHAMYEANLPEKWLSQPVGQACGMSIHESQSLLIEMQVCRSKQFVKFISPLLKEEFGSKSKGFSSDNLFKIYNKVEPSFIRVEADEVTYPAHIMIRYYMEKYLIAGEMEIDDLQEAWNQGMEKFLGVKVTSDKDGCMQDIHWMDGTFGYFPTYTLGSIYAAQLFAAATQADTNILPSIEKGDFIPLKAWLNTNVHELGSKMSADEIVESATGSALDVEMYKNYLKERYLDSY